MKKSFYFKLFTFTFIFFISAISVFAEQINSLNRIVIQPINGNEYTLNFLFDSNYTGKAFLQKNGNNGYYIFLPDTILSSKNANITYSNLSDKRNIQFDVETKPILKGNTQTNYTKVNVYMNDNYKIKLTSGLKSDYHPFLNTLKKIGACFLFILLLVSFAGFIISKFIKHVLNNTESNSYTSFPVNFNSTYNLTLNEAINNSENKTQRIIIPRKTLKNSFSSTAENKFDCFNIETNSKLNGNTYEIKSNLNQTSNLLNDKSNTVKLKHTNPITKTQNIEESELSIPVVDDVVNTNNNNEEEKDSNKPEILSILKLTPNKGFYLISDENSFKLLGYINKHLFLLEKFKDLSQINLQARYYDQSGKNDIYIVRLDKYKAMIEISDSSMKELAKI